MSAQTHSSLDSLPQLTAKEDQLEISGALVTAHLAQWLKLLLQLEKQQSTTKPLRVNFSHLDTNGSRLFIRFFGAEEAHWPLGLTQQQLRLVQLVAANLSELPAEEKPLGWIADIGHRAVSVLDQAKEFFNFVGQLSTAFLGLLAKPNKFKFKLWLDVLQKDGLHAVPIIALLAFLIGAVVAWQGSLQLKTYGANIFIVELVALTHLRELGPLITAILVAGRSGSAYAAEIATMQINQEVTALRSLGQNPFDWLVLPKIMGLMIALPLLTVLADFAGLLGGSLIAVWQLDISPTVFLQRLSQQVSLIHFFIGLIKAPIFALAIVTVGCLQGFLATGGASAVGSRTTRSVVQAIFLVIILDAIFSIIFSDLGW